MLTGDTGAPVVPRSVLNEAGTVLALARQLLMDMDRKALNFTLPTATAELLLRTLVDSLTVTPAVQEREKGLMAALNEPANNPNVRYLRALDNPGFRDEE